MGTPRFIMGLCHACNAQSECPSPTPPYLQGRASKDLETRPRSSSTSSDCSCSLSISHTSTPPSLLKPLSAGSLVDREAFQITGSSAWLNAVAGSSDSSSSDESLPCDCKLLVGAEVTLAVDYLHCLDASQGNLHPGQPGTVGEIDEGMICVHTIDDSWWYGRNALQIKCTNQCDARLGGLKRLRSPSHGTQQRRFRQACQDSICVANLAAARWNQRVRRQSVGRTALCAI